MKVVFFIYSMCSLAHAHVCSLFFLDRQPLDNNRYTTNAIEKCCNSYPKVRKSAPICLLLHLQFNLSSDNRFSIHVLVGFFFSSSSEFIFMDVCVCRCVYDKWLKALFSLYLSRSRNCGRNFTNTFAKCASRPHESSRIYESEPKKNKRKWNCVCSVAWQTTNRLIACLNEIYMKFFCYQFVVLADIFYCEWAKGSGCYSTGSRGTLSRVIILYWYWFSFFYVFAWNFVVSNFIGKCIQSCSCSRSRIHFTSAKKNILLSSPRDWYLPHGCSLCSCTLTEWCASVFLLFLLIFMFHVDVMIFVVVVFPKTIFRSQKSKRNFNGTQIKYKTLSSVYKSWPFDWKRIMFIFFLSISICSFRYISLNTLFQFECQ